MAWKWIERRRANAKTVELVSAANTAISRFGAILEVGASGIMDEALLPLDKPAMKTAFKVALAAETDPKRFEWLKAGWLLLAEFQPGIGSDPLSLPKMPGSFTPEFMAALDRYNQVLARSAKEMEELKAEMEEFLSTVLPARSLRG